jgi:hypothetical protein
MDPFNIRGLDLFLFHHIQSWNMVFFLFAIAHVCNFSSVSHQIFIPTFHPMQIPWPWYSEGEIYLEIAHFRKKFFLWGGRKWTRKPVTVTNVHVQLIELVHDCCTQQSECVVHDTSKSDVILVTYQHAWQHDIWPIVHNAWHTLSIQLRVKSEQHCWSPVLSRYIVKIELCEFKWRECEWMFEHFVLDPRKFVFSGSGICPEDDSLVANFGWFYFSHHLLEDSSFP